MPERGWRQRRGRPTERRACLRCDRPFRSEGPHHRLCDRCRAALARGEADGGETYALSRERRTRRGVE